ncbi:sigma-54 interaction domain-containing protein [Desulfoscipio gibsoniae]|uniref:PAS domain S-box n=1 Tax=Desulfoscipio gibsoniae DSM 7213 TaxID=767817 RepID=R4KDY2_9FIRM|nr:sigma 54-interacting transcriptional regulator [Desulfoscipio gibsoniae]AGL01383.1 PAS domain S-box [Desulfoscipio gibsoniae DSM 7213]
MGQDRQNSQELLNELNYLRQRLAELEEMNRDYLGMIENSYDAMSIADCDGRLLLINPAFERIMGITKSETLSRTIQDLTNDGITDASAALKAFETGKQESVIINTRAGRQVLSTGVPFYDQTGKIVRVYCNIRDVTELNHLRQKFEQSQKLASRYLFELLEFKRGKTFKFVAHSNKIKQMLETVHRIAVVDSTVLILGESGVGKDLVARIIHEASSRNDSGSFLKINCAAIPAELLESELFGYEGGAFTGAKKDGKAGYFEIADKGTLFLDEIGELPQKLQVKLLAVIQDQKITRIGGVKEKDVDVRIIAATNRDLEEMVKQGNFREDLFYRLNVIPITIPPLRERKEDIPFLIVHYTELFNKKYNRAVKFSKEAIEMLCKYNWPGNVRELANLVERVIVIGQESILNPEHIPGKYHTAAQNMAETVSDFKSLSDAVEKYELKLVKNTLELCKTREEAASKLGISLSGLSRRIRRLKQLENEGFI